MNANDTFGAWLAIRNLYRWMPEECQQEVRPLFTEANNALNIINRNSSQMDLYLKFNVKHDKQTHTLFQYNELLCDSIRKSLGRHGWLDKDGTIKPRDENVPTLRVGQRGTR